MTNEQLIQKISSLLPNAACQQKQYVTVKVAAADILQSIKVLKENADLFFDYLNTVTGIDQKNSFGLSYILTSSTHRHTIIVNTTIENRENPEIESLYPLYKTCDFQEREIFDLFGINFKNHPDMRRIFLSDDWVGYPLRKDYVDEVNIVQR
jgi:NADH:ubiquinone oxidoreductase subunit C